MERVSRVRSVILLALFGVVLMLYAGRLFKLQIIDTKGNTDNTATYGTITTVRASRGDILDRNGKVLVGNRATYDLVFNHYVIKSADNRNEYLHNLLVKCDELGVEHTDHLPVTMERPFVYTLDEYTSSWQNHFRAYMVDWNVDPDITAPLLIEKLRARYEIPAAWSDEEARAVIGLRYEFDLRGIPPYLSNYLFIEDVSSEDLSAILELNTPGLMVESSTVREYHTEYAAHLLGYMGQMDRADWEYYQDLGYSMDADIGQAGIEEAFEEYLHGIDGQRYDAVSKDGTIMEQYYVEGKEPIAGNNVEITIDIDLQKVAEDALAEVMDYYTDPEQNTSKTGDGLDAQGAAVVMMEVKTGKILVCASYPTYNLATMNEDWDKLVADDLHPFFNRAFGAAYPPGSTFKPCILTAAMRNGFYKPGQLIKDEGVFTKYPGFSPKCLFYTSTGGGSTHGEITAQRALEVSCNYFFYVLADTMTIEMIDETAKGFGFGEHTGIELVEEVGARSNKETKAKNHQGVDAAFNAGDRVLTGIGQAETRVTPLQLCVYACTLANQGTRYKATFLSRVASADYRTLVVDKQPEIASTMEIPNEAYQTYVEGMRLVVAGGDGTGRRYFSGPLDTRKDFPVAVCAKTGTSEHASGGSDHGAFICFAPMENPEVAVALFGEKIGHGASLAGVADTLLRAYFEMEEASETFTYENQLG